MKESKRKVEEEVQKMKLNEAGFGLACKQAQKYLEGKRVDILSKEGIEEYKKCTQRFYRINMIAKKTL